jgi:hypothetical protein
MIGVGENISRQPEVVHFSNDCSWKAIIVARAKTPCRDILRPSLSIFFAAEMLLLLLLQSIFLAPLKI